MQMEATYSLTLCVLLRIVTSNSELSRIEMREKQV